MQGCGLGHHQGRTLFFISPIGSAPEFEQRIAGTPESVRMALADMSSYESREIAAHSNDLSRTLQGAHLLGVKSVHMRDFFVYVTLGSQPGSHSVDNNMSWFQC